MSIVKRKIAFNKSLLNSARPYKWETCVLAVERKTSDLLGTRLGRVLLVESKLCLVPFGMFTSFHCFPTDAPSLHRKVEPSLSCDSSSCCFWTLASAEWQMFFGVGKGVQVPCKREWPWGQARVLATRLSFFSRGTAVLSTDSPLQHMPSCSIHQLPSEAHPATLLHVPTRARWLSFIEPFSRSSTLHSTDLNFIVLYQTEAITVKCSNRQVKWRVI